MTLGGHSYRCWIRICPEGVFHLLEFKAGIPEVFKMLKIAGLQGKAPPFPPGIALQAGSLVGTWLLSTPLEIIAFLAGAKGC